MPTSSYNLGQKIKRYRLINDIRQEDMAEKMQVSRATLINYEKGHTAINMDVLNRLKNHYPDFELESTKNHKPQIISENTIDFKVLFSVIYSKKNFIIMFTIFFMTAGIVSSFFMKKYYNAEISLYPAKNDLNQSLGQFQSLAANFGMNTPKNDQDFNIPDVVMSRLIASKAVNEEWINKNGNKIKLIELWRMNIPPWYGLLFNTQTDSTIAVEKAIKKFKNHINVTEDRLTGLIKISTTFQDPVVAANIANFIGSQVEYYIQKENSAQSTKEKLFISGRLKIVKNELENSEMDLKDFKERNRGYENSPELFMFFSQLLREVEVKKEVYLTLQQQLELARIEEVKQSPILHVLDSAVPPIRKSSPNRLYFLIISFFGGIIISSLRVVFRY